MYARGTHQGLPPPLHRPGGRRHRRHRRARARRLHRHATTASTATRSPAASTRTRVMAELFGSATGVSGGRGGSMHLFDVSEVVHGRLRHRRRPHAARLRARARRAVQGHRPHRRQLHRRRRRERGRVPRGAQPRRRLEAARALHLREQPLRHGHRRPPRLRRRRDLQARRGLRHRPPSRSTAWTCSAMYEAVARLARARPRRRRPGVPRGDLLPLPRPLDGRRRSSTARRRRSSAGASSTRSTQLQSSCSPKARSTQADIDAHAGRAPTRWPTRPRASPRRARRRRSRRCTRYVYKERADA